MAPRLLGRLEVSFLLLLAVSGVVLVTGQVPGRAPPSGATAEGTAPVVLGPDAAAGAPVTAGLDRVTVPSFGGSAWSGGGRAVGAPESGDASASRSGPTIFFGADSFLSVQCGPGSGQTASSRGTAGGWSPCDRVRASGARARAPREAAAAVNPDWRRPPPGYDGRGSSDRGGGLWDPI